MKMLKRDYDALAAQAMGALEKHPFDDPNRRVGNSVCARLLRAKSEILSGISLLDVVEHFGLPPAEDTPPDAEVDVPQIYLHLLEVGKILCEVRQSEDESLFQRGVQLFEAIRAEHRKGPK